MICVVSLRNSFVHCYFSFDNYALHNGLNPKNDVVYSSGCISFTIRTLNLLTRYMQCMILNAHGLTQKNIIW